MPPVSETRRNAVLPELFGVKAIQPASLQLAPRPFGASHRTTTVPPATCTFLSFPLAKNPTHCPSGEKNGVRASSVPGSAVASRRSRRRTNNCRTSPALRATKARREPSGDSTAAGLKSVTSGASPLTRASTCTSRVAGAGGGRQSNAAPAAITSAATSPWQGARPTTNGGSQVNRGLPRIEASLDLVPCVTDVAKAGFGVLLETVPDQIADALRKNRQAFPLRLPRHDRRQYVGHGLALERPTCR